MVTKGKQLYLSALSFKLLNTYDERLDGNIRMLGFRMDEFSLRICFQISTGMA